MLKHKRVRWVFKDLFFFNIHLAGIFITVTEVPNFGTAVCKVVVLDVCDLIEENSQKSHVKDSNMELTKEISEDSEIWSKELSFQPEKEDEALQAGLHQFSVNAVTNDTSLIVSHGPFLSIHDFWNKEM